MSLNHLTLINDFRNASREDQRHWKQVAKWIEAVRTGVNRYFFDQQIEKRLKELAGDINRALRCGEGVLLELNYDIVFGNEKEQTLIFQGLHWKGIGGDPRFVLSRLGDSLKATYCDPDTLRAGKCQSLTDYLWIDHLGMRFLSD